jgi:hypothetical protein
MINIKSLLKSIIEKVLKAIAKEKTLLGIENMPVFKSRNCYDCNKEINPKSCWQRFIVINDKQYRVNICDECCDKL